MQVANVKLEVAEPVPVAASMCAYVLSEEPDGFVLDVEGANLFAARAVGCLVKPSPGDKVLCFVDPRDTNYVLSVLESESSECTRLSVDNNLIIESEKQDVSVVSKNNINFVTDSQLNLLCNEITISSEKGQIQIDDMTLLAKKSTACVTSGRIFAKQLETVSDNISQRFINSLKFVEKTDQIKAGNIIQSVKTLFSIKARQAIVLAEQDVKIDGERIHMG